MNKKKIIVTLCLTGLAIAGVTTNLGCVGKKESTPTQTTEKPEKVSKKAEPSKPQVKLPPGYVLINKEDAGYQIGMPESYLIVNKKEIQLAMQASLAQLRNSGDKQLSSTLSKLNFSGGTFGLHEITQSHLIWVFATQINTDKDALEEIQKFLSNSNINPSQGFRISPLESENGVVRYRITGADDSNRMYAVVTFEDKRAYAIAAYAQSLNSSQLDVSLADLQAVNERVAKTFSPGRPNAANSKWKQFTIGKVSGLVPPTNGRTIGTTIKTFFQDYVKNDLDAKTIGELFSDDNFLIAGISQMDKDFVETVSLSSVRFQPEAIKKVFEALQKKSNDWIKIRLLDLDGNFNFGLSYSSKKDGVAVFFKLIAKDDTFYLLSVTSSPLDRNNYIYSEEMKAQFELNEVQAQKTADKFFKSIKIAD